MRKCGWIREAIGLVEHRNLSPVQKTHPVVTGRVFREIDQHSERLDQSSEGLGLAFFGVVLEPGSVLYVTEVFEFVFQKAYTELLIFTSVATQCIGGGAWNSDIEGLPYATVSTLP